MSRWDHLIDDNPPDVEPDRLELLRRNAITTDQLKALPPPAWIIDGVLQEDSLAELYGKPGSYKSFVTSAWSLHITTGLWWQGREVRPAPVIYVVAEGATGMGARIDAWEQHHADRIEGGTRFPIVWLPLAIQLGSAAWGEAVGEFAAEHGARLVVFDTRARCTVGVEENSAKEMGAVVANLDAARRLCRACILLVHHSNAFGDKSRGSTAIEGAVDTELSIKSTEDIVTLKLEKQKNGPDGTTWEFSREPVGDSIVLVGGDAPARRQEITGHGWAMFDTLKSIYIDEPVSFSRWLDSGEVTKATFNRQMKLLVDQGIVVKVGKGYEPNFDAGEPDETNETDAPF
jgi:hypothetical protein